MCAAAADPTASPGAAEVTDDTSVTFTSAGANTVCYTVDGSLPTCNSDGSGVCLNGIDQSSVAYVVTTAAAVQVVGCATTTTGEVHSTVQTIVYTVTNGQRLHASRCARRPG